MLFVEVVWWWGIVSIVNGGVESVLDIRLFVGGRGDELAVVNIFVFLFLGFWFYNI